MREYRAVFLVNGVLLLILGVAMLVPALLDAWAGHPDWQVFLAAAFLTGFVGAALAISCWGSGENLQLRQAFVLTTTVWVTTPAFGALPFVFADLDLSYTDAFFEAMSGITTTGSTVISDLEYAPPGILIWRALLQWMGGIGIIVTAVVILPLLQVGGMQLFRIESSDASEKVLPRTAQIAGAISIIYLSLSMICAFVYWAAGMPA
nr:potassium transporter TrkH [Alphaproteobacteria bacterium]